MLREPRARLSSSSVLRTASEKENHQTTSSGGRDEWGAGWRRQTLGREEKISEIGIFNILKEIRGDIATRTRSRVLF